VQELRHSTPHDRVGFHGHKVERHADRDMTGDLLARAGLSVLRRRGSRECLPSDDEAGQCRRRFGWQRGQSWAVVDHRIRPSVSLDLLVLRTPGEDDELALLAPRRWLLGVCSGVHVDQFLRDSSGVTDVFVTRLAP